jgi:hypothetical protein
MTTSSTFSCFFFYVDVFSTNFIVDVIDEFNINLNDDVIYRISEEFAFFKVFKIAQMMLSLLITKFI